MTIDQPSPHHSPARLHEFLSATVWSDMQNSNSSGDQGLTASRDESGSSSVQESLAGFPSAELIFNEYFFVSENPAVGDGMPPSAVDTLVESLDALLGDKKSINLGGVNIKKTDDGQYELDIGPGIKIDPKNGVKSVLPNYSVSISPGKDGRIVAKATRLPEAGPVLGGSDGTWEIGKDGIAQLNEKGERRREHPAHGNWSYSKFGDFESYLAVKPGVPVKLSDGTEVTHKDGKLVMTKDGRTVELDYSKSGHESVTIREKDGTVTNYPRATKRGENGETLYLQGDQQLPGDITINWTLLKLKVERGDGIRIDAEPGAILLERKPPKE